MTHLLNLLKTCSENTKDFQKYFAEIAEMLMNNYVIAKGNAEYEIVEIEFYLFTPDHPDVITYPRKCEPGQWFFHQSGVDLAFESAKDRFGGILIRGIKRITDGHFILGPQKCVYELWDKFNAFDCDYNYPILHERGGSQETVIKDIARWIPIGASLLRAYGGNDSEARNSRICSIISTHQKVIKNNPNLGIDESIYDKLPNDYISKTVFDSPYRFFKSSSLNITSREWKMYTAKPKNWQDFLN